MLKGKNIVLGITGSIAAYKIGYLASTLKKMGADVTVIMTKNATEFIAPLTFETLTGNKVYTDTFDRDFKFEVEHISIAKKADLLMIAPASANIIGKAANGIADDMLSTTLMACTCPVIFAPAMNTAMYENPILQDNLEKLRYFGYEILEPAEGYLACGDTGKGKMPEPAELLDYIYAALAYERDMKGLKVVVTAGPTKEAIDPVRFISNHSSGRMGCEIARVAALRGADVTLVAGDVSCELPRFCNIVRIKSAEDMFNAVTEAAKDADIVVKAAAVADYTPLNVAAEKVKKSDGDLSIELKRTRDILGYLGENKREGQLLCGFSMETENVIENSRKKLTKKNADMIVANDLRQAGAGFGTDTNVVTLITKSGEMHLPIMSKEYVGKAIFDELLKMREE